MLDHRSPGLQPMLRFLKAKLRPFGVPSPEIEETLRDLCQSIQVFDKGHHFSREGEDYGDAYLLEAGWVERHKTTEAGLRQIVNYALPGDFLCFNAGLFQRADHTLIAKTQVEAFVIPIEKLSAMLARHSRLALLLAWCNAHEEALLAERIVSLGRRTASARMAHLFCELHRRLRLLESDLTDSFEMPLTQEDLADTLGLSTVYVNRTLRRLRLEEVVTFSARVVTLLDPDRLAAIAGFDDGYLHFTETQRLRQS